MTEFFLPDAIQQWLQLSDPYKKGLCHRDRVKRLDDFAKKSDENTDSLNKAWRALDRAKKSDDKLLSLFLTWPDEPTAQPFTAIYGKRALDHQAEENLYRESSDKVGEVMALLKPNAIRKLLQDIPSTALTSYRTLNRIETISRLRVLRDLLNKANPKKKYLTKQPFSPDADLQTYIILLAGLNRYLAKPKHAALATIANANYLDREVTSQAIGKAWKRNFKDGLLIEN